MLIIKAKIGGNNQNIISINHIDEKKNNTNIERIIVVDLNFDK